ncbi:MAG: alkaline phosphatase family protein [Alphaproteobacteria bacterium]|nr:MAG: alkaline phosphatase family protein [Alphaproteobacteria bacterium]
MIIVGPSLYFRGCESDYWKISALIVIHESDDIPAFAVFSETLEPFIVDIIQSHQFLRYEIAIPQTNEDQVIPYTVGEQSYALTVPAKNTYPNIFYTSCNRYELKEHPEKGGFETNWREVVFDHAKNPIHLGLGGGDQIYSDGVLSIAEQYIDNPTSKENFQQTVESFYLETYIHYMTAPYYREMLASVPFLNFTDDHEIFNGYGSLPTHSHEAFIYKTIFKVAYRFYLLFQHNMTKDEGAQLGYFGKKHEHAFSTLRHAGPVSILGLDLHGERTQHQMLSKESTDAVFDALETLPTGCKHLLVMSSIPFLFCSFQFISKFFNDLDPQTPRAIERGLGSNILDQWGSDFHLEERDAFFKRLIKFTKKRFSNNQPVRITFLSGEMHIASAGALYEKTFIPPQYNPLYFVQLTSSGIGSTTARTKRNYTFVTLILGLAEHFLSPPTPIKNEPSMKLNLLYWYKDLLLPMPTHNHFISQRNWLRLYFKQNNMQAILFAENESCTLKNRAAPVRYFIDVPGLTQK